CEWGWQRLGCCSSTRDLVDRLGPKGARTPVRNECDGQPHCTLGIRFESPVECRAQLVDLPIKPAKPEQHVGSQQRMLGLHRKVHVVREMRRPEGLHLALVEDRTR